MDAATMNVVYVLTTPIPEDGGDNPAVEQVRKMAKWDNDDYVCRGLILNGMFDSLFDIYQNVESSKELWDSLEAKYIAKDASSKKFLRYFKHTLKHLKEELTLVELGSHLRIEESLRAQDSDKPKGNNVVGPQNKKYLVTFIDDASRFCYVSLLHTKDEALDKLKVFKTKVKLQQGSQIKRFKTDRGGLNQGFLGEAMVVVILLDPKLKTLGERGIECIFVGYVEHSKAFRFSSVPRPSLRIPNGTEDIGEAINDEMESIMGNNTWVLADLPPGGKPLGFKWIFKRKLKVDGTIEKFKARLVIQGFKQKSRIDYFDTYVLVARISTIRLLIGMTSIHNLDIHQMDVKTAFLNGDLDEEQAPKQWHQKFDEVVLSNGYLHNQADKCVYRKFDETSKGVIICLYVDDMLIFGTNQVQVNLTKEFLSSRFSMKDMGEADVILGIMIEHESNGIIISQSHYIEKVVDA
ncbi:zinc finger, CCHC-type containing protein [Tanacetum coccineum]|uniref:Zinc finger, CCHC-type containing protein n=1 Tax=Tanacetum coccineum TaxID=301880 RepID=A0ABQ5G265_9ASTR